VKMSATELLTHLRTLAVSNSLFIPQIHKELP